MTAHISKLCDALYCWKVARKTGLGRICNTKKTIIERAAPKHSTPKACAKLAMGENVDMGDATTDCLGAYSLAQRKACKSAALVSAISYDASGLSNKLKDTMQYAATAGYKAALPAPMTCLGCTP